MSTQWYYAKNGQKCGPVSSQQLQQLAVSGQLRCNDRVWKEGLAEWVPAEKLKGLFPAAGMASPSQSLSPPPTPIRGFAEVL